MSTTETPIRYLNPEPRHCDAAIHGNLVYLLSGRPVARDEPGLEGLVSGRERAASCHLSGYDGQPGVEDRGHRHRGALNGNKALAASMLKARSTDSSFITRSRKRLGSCSPGAVAGALT